MYWFYWYDAGFSQHCCKMPSVLAYHLSKSQCAFAAANMASEQTCTLKQAIQQLKTEKGDFNDSGNDDYNDTDDSC